MTKNGELKTIVTIPNLLSFFRILLVPVFLILYFWDIKNHYVYAALVLLISGLTDVTDGIIARRFHMISTFGKIIDPIADKLTQASVVIAISINHPIFIVLMVMFLIKEFMMLLGSIKLFEIGLRPSEAKWWGKLSTVVIYIFLIMVLISDIVGSAFPYWILYALGVLCAVCIVFSLVCYYPVFRDIKSGKYNMEKERTESGSGR